MSNTAPLSTQTEKGQNKLVKLTPEQAAIIGAYTGFLCGPFSDMHEYIERKLERPVWTHEMASTELMERVRDAAKDDFLAICCPLEVSHG